MAKKRLINDDGTFLKRRCKRRIKTLQGLLLSPVVPPGVSLVESANEVLSVPCFARSDQTSTGSQHLSDLLHNVSVRQLGRARKLARHWPIIRTHVLKSPSIEEGWGIR